MSLLNQTNPIDTFVLCGRQFLAEPEILHGLAFDDAVIALKRHAHVQLNNAALAEALGPFSRLIRERDVATLHTLFAQVEAMLAQ